MAEKTISRHLVRRTARKSIRHIKSLQKSLNTYSNETDRNILEMRLADLGVGIYDAVYLRGPRKHIFRYRVVAVPREDQPTPI